MMQYETELRVSALSKERDELSKQVAALEKRAAQLEEQMKAAAARMSSFVTWGVGCVEE